MYKNKGQILLRKQRILSLLYEGKRNKEIVQIVRDEFKCSESTVQKTLAKVYDELKEHNAELLKAGKEILLTRYENLYNVAAERQDVKNAKAILDSECKLLGLITDKQEVKVEDTDYKVTIL